MGEVGSRGPAWKVFVGGGRTHWGRAFSAISSALRRDAWGPAPEGPGRLLAGGVKPIEGYCPMGSGDSATTHALRTNGTRSSAGGGRRLPGNPSTAPAFAREAKEGCPPQPWRSWAALARALSRKRAAPPSAYSPSARSAKRAASVYGLRGFGIAYCKCNDLLEDIVYIMLALPGDRQSEVTAVRRRISKLLPCF